MNLIRGPQTGRVPEQRSRRVAADCEGTRCTRMKMRCRVQAACKLRVRGKVYEMKRERGQKTSLEREMLDLGVSTVYYPDLWCPLTCDREWRRLERQTYNIYEVYILHYITYYMERHMS